MEFRAVPGRAVRQKLETEFRATGKSFTHTEYLAVPLYECPAFSGKTAQANRLQQL